MELKFSYEMISRHVLVRFNRTFMELKYSPSLSKIEPNVGFNRTFMELKFCRDTYLS